MTMATVRFYRNKYNYPNYTRNLTPKTSEIPFTPKGMTMKGGTLHIAIGWGEVSQYNYIKIQRDNVITWAWIDNIEMATANSVILKYSVDPFRTWQDKIQYSRQFIARQPQETMLYDELLGGTQQAMEQDVVEHTWSSTDKRVLVVQVRRQNTADLVSVSPVQPTPYLFYMVEYETNAWTKKGAIVNLFNELLINSETENLVTMYSVPYINMDGFSDGSLPVKHPGEPAKSISGFKFIGSLTIGDPVQDYFVRYSPVAFPYNKFDMMQVNHDLKILIPGAGIINVSDEAIQKGNLKIRQDIDLFSGGSNFMLTCGSGNQPTGQSVRGASVASIPILSDPYDTYISQNQNALTTSMIGDVASMAAGVGSMAIGNPVGGAMALSGARGLHGTANQQKDMKNMLPSNPPSFLGTAMANHFNNTFYSIFTYDSVDNRGDVHYHFGYPVNMVKELTLPETGFIQTENCSVYSDGSVPQWGIDTINNLFDRGIRVRQQ